jgi:hypothetical protein
MLREIEMHKKACRGVASLSYSTHDMRRYNCTVCIGFKCFGRIEEEESIEPIRPDCELLSSPESALAFEDEISPESICSKCDQPVTERDAKSGNAYSSKAGWRHGASRFVLLSAVCAQRMRGNL